MKKPKDLAKWTIIAFAIAGFCFNTGVLYNHVKTNTKAIARIEARVETLYKFLMDDKD